MSIRDVALKTCQRRWTIERSGEKGSVISVPVVRHDDDDYYFEQIIEQHPTTQQLNDHLPPISQIIQVRPAKDAWYCSRSKDKLVSNILLWTPTHGHTCVCQPAKSYQIPADTWCCLKDLPKAITDRFKLWLRESSKPWWWWWCWWMFMRKSSHSTSKKVKQ